MFNPLVDSFDLLSDLEIDAKVSELSRKYYMSANPQVQQQIAAILDMYREESRARQARAYQRQSDNNGDNSLDSLINIS
tara:strand:+ start:17220 stop:17456 length:237 start_codon:yes stop_codon:yes gene_type:complete